MDLSNPISAIIPSLEGQVLRVLARTTAPLSGSKIAEIATAGSNPGIRAALGRLVQHGTVIARRSGPSVLYTANRDHLAWAAIEHSVQTAESLSDTLDGRIADLVRACLGDLDAERTSLAVFGSVARGASTIDSDIDIVAVFPDTVEGKMIEDLVDGITVAVEHWTGNSCNIYDLTVVRLAEMTANHDPIIESWVAEARTFLGPDLRQRLKS